MAKTPKYTNGLVRFSVQSSVFSHIILFKGGIAAQKQPTDTKSRSVGCNMQSFTFSKQIVPQSIPHHLQSAK